MTPLWQRWAAVWAASLGAEHAEERARNAALAVEDFSPWEAGYGAALAETLRARGGVVPGRGPLSVSEVWWLVERALEVARAHHERGAAVG